MRDLQPEEIELVAGGEGGGGGGFGDIVVTGSSSSFASDFAASGAFSLSQYVGLSSGFGDFGFFGGGGGGAPAPAPAPDPNVEADTDGDGVVSQAEADAYNATHFEQVGATITVTAWQVPDGYVIVSDAYMRAPDGTLHLTPYWQQLTCDNFDAISQSNSQINNIAWGGDLLSMALRNGPGAIMAGTVGGITQVLGMAERPEYCVTVAIP